ncbi:hypothetical protein D1BOALGB6SA_9144 [Olavius sp. associated proteobacterium Delta 1]|nr:hypothetical protein D1BOALGB6SA_9144 [Olavius sp. associated proteobacterium Delta 1]
MSKLSILFYNSFIDFPRLKRIYMPRGGKFVNAGVGSVNFFSMDFFTV